MKTSQEYEPLSSVSMSGMFGWMVYVFTAQWNREHDLAVAQYQVSVEAFDDLQGDESFEAHLYTQLDRQLLEMCDEVLPDRFSWVEDFRVPGSYRADVQFLGGPLGGDENHLADWRRQTMDFPLPQPAYDINPRTIAAEPVAFESARYRRTQIFRQHLALFIPEAPHR